MEGWAVSGRRVWWAVAALALVALAAGGGGYVYERTGPRDADSAGQQLAEDVGAMVLALGLQAPELLDPDAVEGEDCGISDGTGRELTTGPHRQYRIEVDAAPPEGEQPTGLAEEAVAALRDLGYRDITDSVDWGQQPPEGTVVAAWGWNRRLGITLYPDPEAGTVGLTGTADCLPVR
jgi:hypothetical protein